MLHRINLPPYENILKEFLQFQRQLLAFACTQPLAHPIPDTLVKSAIPGYIGEWLCKKLWDRDGKLAGYLIDLSMYIQRLPDAQTRSDAKISILEAFDHDIVFHNDIQDNTQFHFAYLGLDNAICKYIKPLMIYCYDLLCQGFPTQSGTKITRFTRSDLVEAFWDQNEQILTVCPACDGQRPRRANRADKKTGSRSTGKKSKKTYADADHLFPRSLYPLLSVHAWNLVPMCGTCNESKGGTDPIENHAQQTLEDVFHSQKKPAVDDIVIEIITASKIASDVRIKSASHASGKHAATRIQNLNRVFHLEDTWSGSYMDDVLSQIHRDLSADGKYRLGNQMPVDASLVEDYLQKILFDESNKIGKEQYYLLKRSYANYALTNADERNHLVGILFGQEEKAATKEEENSRETIDERGVRSPLS